MKKARGASRKEPTSDALLEMIFSSFSVISQETDVLRLLVLLADMGRDLISADRSTVWLIDRKTETLQTKVAHGVDPISIPITVGIAGEVARTGESLIINDPYNDERFDKDVDKQTGYVTRSILALPIKDSNQEQIGVFQVLNKLTGEGKFTETDLSRLSVAAVFTGNRLEVAREQEEREKTQKEIIYRLAEMVEARSKETGSHIKRVAEYCRILANEHGIDSEQTEILHLASPLHDAGKIAIPDNILNKPASEGRFTDSEFEIMKTHAALGYEMFKNSELPKIAAAAVVAHEHHEHWDGNGYPQKLKGEEIHIFGRIMAIADVFDALASDRIYKKAWPLEKVYVFFKEQKGKQFDPDLVDTFFANKQAFLRIREEYKDDHDAE